MTLSEIDGWLKGLLRFELCEALDKSRNGIQVSRRNPEIKKVAFAVDACAESFRRAAEWGADMLLVHHGILWGALERLEGSLYERVRFLMERDLALYAAHLPLDMHPAVGNNAALARLIGLENTEPFGSDKRVKIGIKGTLPQPMSLDEIALKLTGTDATEVRSFPFGPREVKSVGIMSGMAPQEVRQAIAEGLDLFVTGEPAHEIYHDCLESRIHAIFAGHYWTETFGVRLLGARLAKETGVETLFIDLPTGV
jgi:dinuclear metal center YbgI/SA1388 family protein